MQIIKSTKFKQCKDGTVVNEFLLDEKVTAGFVDYLRQFGEVRILSDLDPPFYSCSVEKCLTVKGMVDDRSIHIRYNREIQETATDRFRSLLLDFPGGAEGREQRN